MSSKSKRYRSDEQFIFLRFRVTVSSYCTPRVYPATSDYRQTDLFVPDPGMGRRLRDAGKRHAPDALFRQAFAEGFSSLEPRPRRLNPSCRYVLFECVPSWIKRTAVGDKRGISGSYIAGRGHATSRIVRGSVQPPPSKRP